MKETLKDNIFLGGLIILLVTIFGIGLYALISFFISANIWDILFVISTSLIMFGLVSSLSTYCDVFYLHPISALLIIIGLLGNVGLGIAEYNGYIEYKEISIGSYKQYYIENTCNLILEQSVACFKGCQYNQIDYNNCTNYCENKYYTEFDDKGQISFCEYRN